MNRQPDELLDEQRSVPLKLDEPEIDPDDPWSDDLLARKDIAGRLTNLIAVQEPPLSISLHGQWGTGKTFLLRRWHRELENGRFKAIYFNAWEDDFCDDPLLAILGQLSDTFKDSSLEATIERIVSTALTLFKESALSVLSNKVGIELSSQESERNPLKDYFNDRRTKDCLREELQKLSEAVFEETNHPLVFIIDELDRCRPTFAIELLERVKHIFDVPHLVFVIGINRDELCKSLSSIYGEINTDIYLRRFFDFEFQLQEVDSRAFTENLIDRFQLGAAFQSLDRSLGGATLGLGQHYSAHTWDYNNYREIIPSLWGALGLSLRDIDYGMRLLALLVRNVRPRDFSHPFLLSVMLALKFHKPEYYRQLISGNFRAGELTDYLAGAMRPDPFDRQLSHNLDRIEGFLYCAENADGREMEPGDKALTELSRVSSPAGAMTPYLVISQRAQRAEHARLEQIKQAVKDGRRLGIDGLVLDRLAALIDTYQADVRY